MANTILGTVLEIGNTIEIPTKSGSKFYKRMLVVDASTYDTFTGEKRENYPSFQFLQRHTEDLNNVKVGDKVAVKFFVSGRKYEKDGETRFFNEVVGYAVEKQENTQNAPQSYSPEQSPIQGQQSANLSTSAAQQTVSQQPNVKTDDLPF